MPGDDVLMMPVAHRVEVFTATARRRRWSAEAKARIVAESHATSVGDVAERYGLAKTQLFTWRREARLSGFAPVVVEDAPVRRDGDAAAGLIEVELEHGRIRLGRGADERLALAVIGALRR